jgi:enoyl-CoA hydratase/carnithine racemase
MAPSHLRVEHSPAGYRRLLLSRPERRNALDVGLAQALQSVTAAGGRLDRLHAERQANGSAWAQAIAPAGE